MITLTRSTKETDIKLSLNINGKGECDINTGIGFFDHMLHALCKHAYFDINLTCKGDLEVDGHHSVEDCAIVLGMALNQAIYPLKNAERFGDGIAVMDEAAVQCALDLSNRAFLVFDVPMKDKIGNFDSELVEEFMRAFCFNAKISLHIRKISGTNAHHIAEACFKALAIALRRALRQNERALIPSTKGLL